MEHLPQIDIDQSEEERVREEQYRQLESLSGFSRLSEDQQRYIKATLYIQQRAERGSDPVSESRIKPMPPAFENVAPGRSYIEHSSLSTNGTSGKGEYFQSQLHIMNQYCHGAIAKLERYAVTKESNAGWYEAGPITSFLELTELVELACAEHKFPLVIQVSLHPAGERGSALQHSTVLLGQDADGEYTVWEKSGYHMPFQIAPLKLVYEAYKKSTGWRIRPLSV
jgi:hypothetical protein